MIQYIKRCVENMRETKIMVGAHLRSFLRGGSSSKEPPFLVSLAESYTHFVPGRRGSSIAKAKEQQLSRMFDMDMPGRSYEGPIDFTTDEIQLRNRLQKHVHELSEDIGMRNTSKPEALEKTAIYIEKAFGEIGLDIRSQWTTTSDGHKVRNIEGTIAGDGNSKTLIVGAHYDTVDCPGADDNATGIGGLIEIARFVKSKVTVPDRTIRFVAFVNEEPPYFHSSDMGSLVYALDLAARDEKVYCMICLEMLGYFSDQPGAQQIPQPLHLVFNHTKGDFIGFTSNTDSKEALKDIVGRFRNYARVPSEGLAGPSIIPGLSYSDHWSFWQAGYKAVMVTDTAFMRYPHYHTSEDTIDKLDFLRFTKVVSALSKTVLELTLDISVDLLK